MPTYPPYGKRILLDNGWFKTLTRPNVELVTDPIDHFSHNGIVTAEWRVAAGRCHRDLYRIEGDGNGGTS